MEERLWAYVDKSGPHWLWTGNVNAKGYGSLGRGRRDEGKILAHVAAWEVTYGPVPKGLCVLHRCDIPACTRPTCLFLGTIADNNRDMCNKGRNANQQKTKCPYGHEYTPENTLHKKHGRQCRICNNGYERKRRAAKKLQIRG